MFRPCLYKAHVYRDDVTLDLGRYYIYGTDREKGSEEGIGRGNE
jgi:hypothetical protein